ncbi:MAG: Mth938-like domain-containing protein [Herbaspirillum sp.]
MKLHATTTQAYQTVTAYDDQGIEINTVRYQHSLLVSPETPPVAWPVSSFESLNAEHFAQIDAGKPDVVILGTGDKQHFVHPRLIAALTARRAGVECMDNKAACRTYNILMAEDRRVTLALILDLPAAPLATPPVAESNHS